MKLTTLNRRQILGGLGGAAALGTAGVFPRSAHANTGEITILTWETYHDDAWLAEYTAKTGVKINAVRAGSADEMYAQLRSGAIAADIVYIDTGSVPRYIEGGLIASLDPAAVANAGNVSPAMGWQAKLTIDGKLWGMPYNWGTQPLMFNRDATGEEPTSWSALWDPKYAGKVLMFDDAYVTIPMIALKIGAADPFNMTNAEFEACAAALRELRPQVATIAKGFDDASTILAAGDAVIGYCQNIAIVIALQAAGKNFGYSFPTEGTPTWIDNAVLTPTGARTEVYDFISANLDPAWQARFISAYFNNGVLTADGARAAGIAEDVLVKTNILDQTADGFWEKLAVFRPPEDIDRRLALWNDFKAGTL